MKTLSGFSNVEVEFTKDGQVSDPAQVSELRQALGTGTYTSLLVVAHGWNNDADQARRLVERLVHSLSQVARSGPTARPPASTLVLSAIWPAKKFADDDLDASPAAGLEDSTDAIAVEASLKLLEELFPDTESRDRIQTARSLVPSLETDEQARAQFADLVRSLLERDAAEDEDASDQFFAQQGEALMDRLAGGSAGDKDGAEQDEAGVDGPVSLSVPAGTLGPGDGAGDTDVQAAGFGGFIRGAMGGARDLLNFTTYYEMKRRAGKVGEGLASRVLTPVLAAHPGLHVHLVGHSFGGRLVTAAAQATASGGASRISSLSLLQAAFSHYGFAENFHAGRDGAFRSVVTKRLVSGPIVITHTKNDLAVGKAYPIASRIAGQDSSALGDENDRFGGMGRNGAQKTKETTRLTMLAVGDAYTFEKAVTNVQADAFVVGHSTVTGREVAHLVASAMAAGEAGD